MEPGHRLFRLLVLFVTLSFAPGVAGAGGFGAYFEYPHGEQKIEFDLVDADFTNNRFGAGLVLDSNVARDELLNVRASAGYVRTENTVDDEAHGGAFDLAVGFSLWRARQFRVWAAPAARIGIDYYDSDFAEILDLGFGGGPRVGLNWHVSDQVSIAPSVSYQFMYIHETIKDDFGSAKFNGTEHLVTARLTFLFRDAGDVFARRRVATRVTRKPASGSDPRTKRSRRTRVLRQVRKTSD